MAKLGRSAGWIEELNVMKGLWLGSKAGPWSIAKRLHQLPGSGAVILSRTTH